MWLSVMGDRPHPESREKKRSEATTMRILLGASDIECDVGLRHARISKQAEGLRSSVKESTGLNFNWIVSNFD